MKFIQIISQGKALGTREIFTHTRIINVSQILEITSGMGRDVDYCRIIMSNGEEILLERKSYNALIDLIQDKWEGIRVLPCVEEYKDL